MLRRLLRDFGRLRYALLRYYRQRGRRPLTPEQEVDRLLREMRQREELARRLTGRR